MDIVIMTIGAHHLLDLPRLLPTPGPRSHFVDAVATPHVRPILTFWHARQSRCSTIQCATGWSVWVAVMLGTPAWRSWWARLILTCTCNDRR